MLIKDFYKACEKLHKYFDIKIEPMIRLYKKGDEKQEMCPITAVCLILTNKYYSEISYNLAGKELGMRERDVERIAKAADGELGYEKNPQQLNQAYKGATVNRATLKKIAKQARNWAEKNRGQTINESLRGMCARASVHLFSLLKQRCINASLCYTLNGAYGGHMFVTVGDFIVDVTATQFGVDKKVVVKKRPAKTWYWTPQYSCNTIHQALAVSSCMSWENDQQVKNGDYDERFYNI